MDVVFRADASVEIGTGHVMRCLALADTLRSRGARARFVCRSYPGNLLDAIRGRGHDAFSLEVPSGPQSPDAGPRQPVHADWLGVPWEVDARQTRTAMQGADTDWLIVDHYGIDARWEGVMRPMCRHLLTIDDLADRPHACDLLVDQNLGRSTTDYSGLVPPGCTVLAGARYALLRPRFAELRNAGLPRRSRPRLLLVAMGGVDKDNVTGRVLDALRSCPLPTDVRVTAVLGARAPCLDEVRAVAASLPWHTQVLVDVPDMAALLTEVDLAIGAAGTSAWERCCMGIPTLTFVIAENQRSGAQALHAAGAALLVAAPEDLPAAMRAALAPGKLQMMRDACMAITDGRGAERVVQGLKHVPA